MTCLDSTGELTKIEQHIKTHIKSAEKYIPYQDLLKNSSEQELMARLTYAEVLAANCTSLNLQMVEPIATVIWNRHKLFKQSLREVIFTRDQFASSLNIYKESRYKDFLCPKDKKLWAYVQEKIKDITEGKSSLFESTVVHYYLFKHSVRFKPPSWAQGPQSYLTASWNGSHQLAPCVQFFKTPKKSF